MGNAVAMSVRGPRILHAPLDVGGQAAGLSRAERELGLTSDVAVLAPGPFGYGADFQLSRRGPLPVRAARHLRMLGLAMRRYDVIHFNFGHTFLSVWRFGQVLDELPLVRRAGKTIIATFQGCDVRPPEYCYCGRSECWKGRPYRSKSANRLLRYAHRCFHLNPDLERWLPGSRFLPYASVDPRAVVPPPERDDREEVVIIHAPTKRNVKGTAHVIAAVERLRGEGLGIRLDLVEGVMRSEVLRRLAGADIVVDQLMLGWYGGFAVEAMCMAKPVLCRIDPHQLERSSFDADLPIVDATPETLVARLRELARDRQARRRIGEASRRFAERHHDPRNVARQVLTGIVDLPGAPAASQSA